MAWLRSLSRQRLGAYIAIAIYILSLMAGLLTYASSDQITADTLEVDHISTFNESFVENELKIKLQGGSYVMTRTVDTSRTTTER